MGTTLLSHKIYKKLTLSRIHFISGVIITAFTGFHLFNHSCSILGAEYHLEMMKTLRLFYRNLFMETMLLGAVLIQLISGTKLFMANRKTASSYFDKLHIWTGLYLAFFLVVDTSAALTGRFILHLDTNFYFGVAGLNSFPFNIFFVPYYGLAIISFFGHLAAIHSKKNENLHWWVNTS